MDVGSRHPFGDDSAVNDYEVQLVHDFWGMGFSNADVITRLTTIANYLMPKLQAAQYDLQNFMAEHNLTVLTKATYAQQSNDIAIWPGSQYPAGTAVQQVTAPLTVGRITGTITTTTPVTSLPTNISILYAEYVGQLQDFVDRLSATQAVLKLFNANDSASIANLNAQVHPPTAQSFWEESDLPLQAVILAPVVTVNPITGAGQALYDTASIAASDPTVQMNTVQVNSDGSLQMPSDTSLVMPGSGASQIALPGFTPQQATETAVQSAAVQAQGSSLLVMLALGVAVFALVKK